MKAKEIVNKFYDMESMPRSYRSVGPEKLKLRQMIKDYAKQKCKEQREICAELEHIPNENTRIALTSKHSEWVRNAPEPDFN